VIQASLGFYVSYFFRPELFDTFHGEVWGDMRRFEVKWSKRKIQSMKDKTYLPLLFVVPLVPVLFFLLQEAHVAKTLGFPLDDAWIFWVFAKNLATGQGFLFNPDQSVLGTTSILWVFVLAGSYLLTHNVVFISKLWGVIFFLSAIFLTYRICLFYTRKKIVAFLGVLTFSLSPPLIFGAVSGMEISLATLLLCLTLFFHLREMGRGKKVFLAPIFGALCFTARPELIPIYPALLLHDYVNRRKGGTQRSDRSTRSTIFRRGLVFVIFLSPTLVFTRLITGSFLPNTFAAKTLDSGLIWAITNGSLAELFISVTLNPFVWSGTMLAALVSLNAFWAFFWSRGLVLSILRRDLFIYPVVFLLVPMLRGIVAPVGNSFYGEHRYVAFLFPLLAIFFVIGWEKLEQMGRATRLRISLRKWLFSFGGAALILTFIFYLNPLVRKDEIFRFLLGPYFPSMLNFCNFKFIFCFTVVFMVFASLLGSAEFFTKRPSGRRVICLLLIAGIVLQISFLLNRGKHYALSVKNINQMQVHLGKWMSQNIPKRSLVAINDAGAIKFFGNRECLDLEGLASPQIIPYKTLGAESYVVYLNKHRPDYFIIFPFWYPEVYTHLGLWERVLYEVKLEDNVACGGPHMTVSKPDWEFFDSTFQNSGLLDLEPYIPNKSLKRRWDDALQRQVLPPDWKVYEKKGRESWVRRNLKEAEKFYQKAESYNPQNHQFYLRLGAFYREKGDRARAAMAFQKAADYQLFPFPDYSPLIER